MNVCQKELILLPFPFSNLEDKKVRPAIVISNNFFNKKGEDCLIVPLTTVMKEEPYSILLKQENLVYGKLIKDSRVRADKITSIEKNLILLKIGAINDLTFKKIQQEIHKLF